MPYDYNSPEEQARRSHQRIVEQEAARQRDPFNRFMADTARGNAGSSTQKARQHESSPRTHTEQSRSPLFPDHDLRSTRDDTSRHRGGTITKLLLALGALAAMAVLAYIVLALTTVTASLSSDANIRNGAGTSYGVRAVLPEASRIRIQCVHGDWAKLATPIVHVNGYIHSSLIDVDRDPRNCSGG